MREKFDKFADLFVIIFMSNIIMRRVKSVATVERDNDVVTDMRWQQWQRRGLSITHGQVMAVVVVGDGCHAAVYILTTNIKELLYTFHLNFYLNCMRILL